MEDILVTGGCGFIGSHLVDRLMADGNNVCVVDNLSTGDFKNLFRWRDSPTFRFIKDDLQKATFDIPEDCGIVYHFAANPDVRVGSLNPLTHFQQNLLGTFGLLEAVRKSKSVKLFVFASTSTVYGEPKIMPTPEDDGPLKPISTYGASKLGCEALISSYAYTFGFEAVVYRLANVIGKRSTHGVIYDLIQKLEKNPIELEILGDGSQTKSYLHISDCIDGIAVGVSHADDQVSILNVGSEDQINVMKIAELVCQGLGIDNVKYRMNPMTPDGRGWPGDVKLMNLDVSKLKSLGWRPKMNSREAVVRTIIESASRVTRSSG